MEVLERRGMIVSRSKTEYMCVNEREGGGMVRLQQTKTAWFVRCSLEGSLDVKI